MLFAFRLSAIAALALVLGAAYAKLGVLLGTGLLAILCCLVLCVLWVKTSHVKDAVLHDPAISTLVFPPESKFQQSILPRK